ncbi:hypothetical protein DFP72DRAFT_941283 [Ephemerocybe angulata]|uniref:Uncharacterized protein n=1 Tax=Ephemerocybe angulata TaxID=980116 RepID=A0A8H6LV33_9AGAR|nr:hypothetical protein DFP72DRAFT_941283 [Tulosesus angulatus]
MRLSGLVTNFFLLGSPLITALVKGRPIAISKERSIALDARNQNAELYALLARNQELAEYLVRELDVDFDALVEVRKAASESSSSKTVDISRSSPEGAVESNTDVQSNDAARTARLGSKNIDTPHLTTPLESQATDSGRTPSTATSPKSSQSPTGRSGAPGSPDPLPPPHNTPLQPPPPPAVSAGNKTWGGGWWGTTTSSGGQTVFIKPLSIGQRNLVIGRTLLGVALSPI